MLRAGHDSSFGLRSFRISAREIRPSLDSDKNHMPKPQGKYLLDFLKTLLGPLGHRVTTTLIVHLEVQRAYRGLEKKKDSQVSRTSLVAHYEKQFIAFGGILSRSKNA